MKIVILSPLNPKRPVSWTENLVNALANLGHDIYVVSGFSPKKVLTQKTERRNRVSYHYYYTLGRFSIYCLYIIEILKIRRIVKKIKPDIVHGQGTEGHSALAAIHSGFPYIVTIHGIINEIYKDKNSVSINISKLLEKYILKAAKNIISINPYVKGILIKYEIPLNQKRIFNISNPVSQNFFTNNKENGKIIKILFCGVFRDRKGLLDLLKAITLLDIDNYKLSITGIEPNDAESKLYIIKVNEFIKNNSLENRIEWKGFIAHKNMPDIMSTHNILVLPSKIETAPMVISEAMAGGLVAIAYDVGGLKYMIQDNLTGYIVPLNNSKVLAEKLLYLLKNKNILNTMGNNAKRIATKEYHEKVVAQKTINAYQKVIDFS